MTWRYSFLWNKLLVATIAGALFGFVTSNPHPEAELTIQPTYTDVVRFVNDSYIVVCSGHNGTKVKWLSPRGEVALEGRGRVHTESRDNVVIGAQALIFEHINLTDRGDWACRSDEFPQDKIIKMTVNEPISFVDTASTQTAREDGESTVKCLARGDPPPSVSWYLNGSPITIPNPKYQKIDKGLIIKNVTVEDRGEYTCRAFQVSTSASSVQEQIIHLNIQHKPIAVKKLPHHAKAEEAYGYISGTVNLTCEARAEPAANFTWHRNGKPVAKSSGRIFEDTHMSVLEVPIPDRTAFGDYMCKARNFMGTMERIITLIEGQRPDPPTEVILRGANSDFVDIDVKSSGIIAGPSTLAPHPDNLPIIGYRFQFMPLPQSLRKEPPKPTTPKPVTSNDVHEEETTSIAPILEIEESLWKNASFLDLGVAEGTTYILTGLQHNTPYVIRAMSRNAAGFSTPSPVLFCHTLRLQPYSVFGSASSSQSPSAFTTFVASAVMFVATVLHRPLTISSTKKKQIKSLSPSTINFHQGHFGTC